MDRDWKELVDDASQGDEPSLEALLTRMLPGLRAYLHQEAGQIVVARESTSDLLQSVCREVLERLAEERLEYRGEAEFRSWLYRAATLKLMNRHRFQVAGKRDLRREVVARPPGNEASSPDRAWLFPHQETPSQDAQRREQAQRMQALLTQLPENHRRILTLVHLDGLSHREAAERLQISEANSRTLLHRAMARLATVASATPEADDEPQ